MNRKIEQLRKKIDRLDEKLLNLLNQRAELGMKIGKEKVKGYKNNFHVPDREMKIYERICRLNPGPLPGQAVKAIYREILSATLSLERPLTIGYLGPEATFTHEASLKQFGSCASYFPLKDIAAIFSEVERGKLDYGIVPIENSNEGIVSHTLDLFVDSPLIISGEIILKINHYLLSREQNLKKIRKLYSHSQALAQCRLWINHNLNRITVEEVSSTAKAAQRAAKERLSAAIASEPAALIYGLRIIAKNIGDNPQNYTRFLVIGSKQVTPSGRDKTSLLLSIKDKPGSLYHILRPFVRAKINLTKIESRPIKRRAWKYLFFIDLEGHRDEKEVESLLAGLKKQTEFLKILGSYPRG